MEGDWGLPDIKRRVAELQEDTGALGQEVAVTDLVAIYILAKG